MTLQELVSKALQAEGEGIPVDWRTLTQHVLRNAQQGVAELESKLVTRDGMILELEEWREDVYVVLDGDTRWDNGDIDEMVDRYRDKEKEAEAPNQD